MHPSFEILKTYLAQVPGPVRREVARQLRAGVELEDGPVAVHSFRVLDSSGSLAMVEVVLHEGRKHIVRRLLEHVGHPVRRLVRTAIGPVRLGNQRPGALRPLTRQELAALYAPPANGS
jgi:23S rRNA pseudouridine2605 synthase